MKTNALCPISDKQINEKVARFNALFTVILILAFSFSSGIILAIFLTLDFLLRATDNSKYSPIAKLSVAIVKYSKIESSNINAGPKLFAARIGLLFSSLILISTVLNASVLALSFTAILGFFSFLEAAFSFCVACEIYPFIYKLLYRQKFDGLKMVNVNLGR